MYWGTGLANVNRWSPQTQSLKEVPGHGDRTGQVGWVARFRPWPHLRGLDTDLHVQELGLQNLHKQLLGHSLCQGIRNHLGAREHVLHTLTFSDGFPLRNDSLCTASKTTGTGPRLTRGSAWLLGDPLGPRGGDSDGSRVKQATLPLPCVPP